MKWQIFQQIAPPGGSYTETATNGTDSQAARIQLPRTRRHLRDLRSYSIRHSLYLPPSAVLLHDHCLWLSSACYQGWNDRSCNDAVGCGSQHEVEHNIVDDGHRSRKAECAASVGCLHHAIPQPRPHDTILRYSSLG